MPNKLKPCPVPWCEFTEPPYVYPDLDDEDNVAGYRVNCPECDTDGPRGNSEAEAVAAWNTRPESAEVRTVAVLDNLSDAAMSVWIEVARELVCTGSASSEHAEALAKTAAMLSDMPPPQTTRDQIIEAAQRVADASRAFQAYQAGSTAGDMAVAAYALAALMPAKEPHA